MGEVLEMLPTFQKLADTYTELTRKRGDVMKSCDGVADEQAQGVPSELCRLEVGLAVRQVCHEFNLTFHLKDYEVVKKQLWP